MFILLSKATTNFVTKPFSFENLIVELHVLYTSNTHVKFVLIGCYLLYDPSIYFFMYNFRLQNLAI